MGLALSTFVVFKAFSSQTFLSVRAKFEDDPLHLIFPMKSMYRLEQKNLTKMQIGELVSRYAYC